MKLNKTSEGINIHMHQHADDMTTILQNVSSTNEELIIVPNE